MTDNPNRPKPARGPIRKPVTVRMTDAGETALADFARTHDITFSEAARRCIAAGLQHLTQGEKR